MLWSRLKKYLLIFLNVIWVFISEVLWRFDLILIYVFLPLAYAYKKYIDPCKNFGFLETVGLTFLLGSVIFLIGIIGYLIWEFIVENSKRVKKKRRN